MSDAKVRLSQKEMEIVANAELILTKNAIIQKVNLLLSGLQEKQKKGLESFSMQLPPELIQSTPKISKGENYKGLPYLILDYPRIFEQENIIAIRTMFWWGNFFSITLHLSGVYKKMMEKKIIASVSLLKENRFYCCVNKEQWVHDFEKTNYLLVSDINKNFEKVISDSPFIKLATRLPLQQWDDAEEILLHSFGQIVELLAD